MFNVYKLSCNKTGQVYYGSTEETVERRLELHEIDYKSYLNGYMNYITSFEIIKNNNYEIKLLETCNNKIHMRDRENLYIDNFPCVNINRAAVPGRTQKEYYETFKEEILEKCKEYRENNKEKIAEKDKKRKEKNKEKIAEKNKEKYTCACGSILTIHHKARHERTIKHKKYLETL